MDLNQRLRRLFGLAENKKEEKKDQNESQEAWTELIPVETGEDEDDDAAAAALTEAASAGEECAMATESPVEEEISIEESPVGELQPSAERGETATKALSKKHFDALAGYAEPLAAEEALEEYLALGWDATAEATASFLLGRRPCLRPYLKRIVEAYPAKCAAFLEENDAKIPFDQRLLLLSSGEEAAAALATEIKEALLTLETEELPAVFVALSAYPSEEGNALLVSLLAREDWKLKMKAASALAKANAFEAIPAIRQAAAEMEGSAARGLLTFAAQMEKAAEKHREEQHDE